jgi:Peptidase family M28
MKLATCDVGMDSRNARSAQVQRLGASWVRFGDRLLLVASNAQWGSVATQAVRGGFRLEEYPSDVNAADLYLVVQKGRLFQQQYPDVPVLLDKGRYLAVKLSPEERAKVDTKRSSCFGICPLPANTVVFDVRPRPSAREAPVDWIQDLVDEVTRTTLESSLTHLASFPTRLSTSAHYLDAAEWCRGQLETLGYSARLETIAVGNATSRNVIATKSGSGPGTRELILLVAHLDSVNTLGGPDAPAPGADDNGSGSAGLLELARILAPHQFVQDIEFVLFGGEEQGLLGSMHYVNSLPMEERARIRAVINMDMIGTLNTPAPTVLLEGASVSQSVIDDLANAAATYTSLTVETSLSPFASDHVPFIDAGLPAVLTIEGADSVNTNIHTANDTLVHINYDLAMEILKMNVAFIATKLDRAPTGQWLEPLLHVMMN